MSRMFDLFKRKGGMHCDPDDVVWAEKRAAMVRQLRLYNIRDERILAATGRIRRHVFIPPEHRGSANPYGDHPCPIGHGQTISQPFIVAYMTERLNLKKGDKVLEIGTGSGYQAAVLAELGSDVYSVELIPELADHAQRVLEMEGYGGVRVKTGDAYDGWPRFSPFDAIIATCAPETTPDALTEQLKQGGRMILPVGAGAQQLVVVSKSGEDVLLEEDIAVRFVPMVRRTRA